MKAGRLSVSACAILASTALSRLDAADPGLPPAPAVGPSWETVDGDGTSLTLLDRAGVRWRGRVARARFLSINERVNAEGVSMALVVLELDCRTGAGAVIEARRYRADGSQIDGGIVPAAARERRIPAAGSRDSRLAAPLCGRAALPPRAETVLIRFRHSYPVCAGLCPDFETQISPMGYVVSRNLHQPETHHFRVDRLKLASFWAILDTIRPSGERRFDAECPRSRQADGTLDTLDDPRPDDFEVRWISGGTDARLTACAFTQLQVRRTVENALHVLGVDPYFGSREDPRAYY